MLERRRGQSRRTRSGWSVNRPWSEAGLASCDVGPDEGGRFLPFPVVQVGADRAGNRWQLSDDVVPGVRSERPAAQCFATPLVVGEVDRAIKITGNGCERVGEAAGVVVVEPLVEPTGGGVLAPGEVDSQEGGSVPHGAARRPLNEEDGSDASHGLDVGVALKVSEVLLVPVLFQERGDVLGVVAATAGRRLGSASGAPEAASGWFGGL